jgi:hypothetical protein
MRSVLLTLVLANVLMLAWQFWVDPAPPAPVPAGFEDLVAFTKGAMPNVGWPAPSATELAAPRPGACLRVGPLPTAAAAQQAIEQLAARGIDAAPIARDTQVWLGHWVQIGGFVSMTAAETARRRLTAGGLADAYLMQDGVEPMLSLGVFRDRSGADRVVSAARTLGFEVSMRDRYRPTVEQWLFIRPRPGQTLGPEDVSLAGDRIVRTESAGCEAAGAESQPDAQLAAPALPK